MKQWVQQLWTATEIGSALVWHRWISLLVQAVISTTSIQCQNVLYVCNLSVLPAFSQSSYHLCLFGLFFYIFLLSAHSSPICPHISSSFAHSQIPDTAFLPSYTLFDFTFPSFWPTQCLPSLKPCFHYAILVCHRAQNLLGKERLTGRSSQAGSLEPFLLQCLHYRLNKLINSRFWAVLLVVATLRKTESVPVVFVTVAPTICFHFHKL